MLSPQCVSHFYANATERTGVLPLHHLPTWSGFQMNLFRFLTWTLLLYSGFALPTLATAQEQPLPTKSFAAFDAVSGFKEARGINPSQLKSAQATFATFAKYYADVVAHPAVHKAAQEPKVSTGGPKVPTIDWDNDTGILRDLDRFILEPVPGSKINAERLDYIRELAVALDAALKPLVEGKNPEKIVRLNATRVLAVACKSGAQAHWPTVTGLLTNVNTPTEIKYYALQAAANLLAAYDVNEYAIRKHSNGPEEVGALVRAVQECVVNPNAIMTGLPGGKVENATSEQLAVISFVRRQAIRTLGKVRFVALPGPDGKLLYPAHTLARVCLSDPALIPSPGPSDCAEAIIGLCNMAPTYMGKPIKNFNADAAIEAITAGLITFAKPRTNPADRSLPWRGYSARLAEALRNWRPLFDPLFNPLRPKVFNAADVPGKLDELIERAQTAIFTPIDKLGLDGKPDLTSPVEVQRMAEFLKQLRDNPKRNPLLFAGVPETTIAFPDRK